MASRNRFSVVHSPTKTPSLGNWAVKNRNTGRLIGRHQTQAAARQHAASRGSAVRRSTR